MTGGSRCPAELHREERGSGPPLLFLHGFAGSARNWRPQVRTFAASFRTLTFDHRGHARSAVPPAGCYGRARFHEDIDALLVGVEEPAVLVGLSMGAGLALTWALEHPRRVRALVLAACPRSEEDEGHRAWADGFADDLEARGIDAAGTKWAWGPGSRFDARARELVRQGFLEHRPEGLARVLRELVRVQPGPESLAPRVEELDVPVLLIAGSEDTTALRHGARYAELLPRASLVTIAGAGHVVNLAAPREFDAAVASFLA